MKHVTIRKLNVFMPYTAETYKVQINQYDLDKYIKLKKCSV